MNKIYLGLMLAFVSIVARAEWTNIGGDDIEIKTYVDLSTIRITGDLAKLWVLDDYKNIQKVGSNIFSSAKSLKEYDCKEELTRIIILTEFGENMGQGEVIESYSYEAHKWKPVEPGSYGQQILKIACSKQ